MVDRCIANFFGSQPQRQHEAQGKDRNKKARLILLACQMLAVRLGLHGQSSSLRITLEALARSYFEDGESKTEAGAKKMAERDVGMIESVFGITGNDAVGYQLGMSFKPPKAYLQMLEHWLNWLHQNHHSRDTVLEVMLEGLIVAINSAFTSDPICIPKLAQALTGRYSKSNKRDAKRPLEQLFHDRAMAHFLPLEIVSEEDDSYKVDTRLEPLLLRKKKSVDAGYDTDDTLVLSRPGLIRSGAHQIIQAQPEELTGKLHRICRAVEQMECWQNEEGRQCIPYALHYQQASNDFELVTYWHDHDDYEEMSVSAIGHLPEINDVSYYCPEEISEELWNRWKSLSFWRV